MSHLAAICSERRFTLLDVLLRGVVVLFAFLAASTVENSSAFWSHLVAGQRLVQGNFSLRALLSPSGVFDGGLYVLYRSVGGTGLIVLKALAVGVLAGLLLPPRADGANAALLAAGTLLALLALTPYLALRPVLLSYFFFVATLRLLLAPPKEQTWKRYALGGLLFVLWVNLDSWFWLGPLLVILFWLGEGKERCMPWWLLGASVLVCLLNPRGFYVFAPPPGWLPQPWWSESPWQIEHLKVSIRHFDLASLAYPALMGMALVSLMLPGVLERGRRALVWVMLAALSSWRSALVPFFALLTGPITVLNLQDAFHCGTHTASESKGQTFSLLSALLRWLLLAGNVLLIFLAAVGGLRGLPRGTITPGWGVDAELSPQQFVATLQRWRQRGWLRAEDRLLAVPHELIPYFAWFASDEPFPEEQPKDLSAWATAARAGKGNLVAVDDPELFRQLSRASHHWLLLHVEGRFTLWGWKEACAELARRQPFAASRLAFAPNHEDQMMLPPVSPPRDNYPSPSLLERLLPWRAPPGRDSETAATYLRYFQSGILPPYRQRWMQGWSIYAASLAAPPPPVALSLLLQLEQPPGYLRDIDQDLPALPLLAIRAARHALATDPNDAHAYLRLGQAYHALWEMAGERVRCRDASLFAHLRLVQTAMALEQAVRLDPDLEAPHRLLATLYLEQGYLDAALDHRREEVRLAHRAGPQQGEDQGTFIHRLKRLEEQTRALAAEVEERQKAFAALPASITQPRERALAAIRLGLARQALDEILVPSSPILLESNGVNLELELLLHLGRREALRDWMQGKELETYGANLGLYNLPAPPLPGYPLAYRLPAAAWFRLNWAAALGNYDLAQGQVHKLLAQLEATRQEQLRLLRRSLTLTVAEEILLTAEPSLLFLRVLAQRDRLTASQFIMPVLTFQDDRADLTILGGLLSLERGWPQQAAQEFRTALRLSSTAAGAPLAALYLQRIHTISAAESHP